jgi:hypothetical protein
VRQKGDDGETGLPGRAGWVGEAMKVAKSAIAPGHGEDNGAFPKRARGMERAVDGDPT